MIKLVAQSILQLCNHGIQVFIASHSLFLLRELEILKQEEYSAVATKYFALQLAENGVAVSQSEDLHDVNPLVLLDEELFQSDRFLSAEPVS